MFMAFVESLAFIHEEGFSLYVSLNRFSNLNRSALQKMGWIISQGKAFYYSHAKADLQWNKEVRFSQR